MEEKYKILVAGAGKIGVSLANLLASSDDYTVLLADIHIERAEKILAHHANLEMVQCDVHDHSAMSQLFQTHNITAVVSSLPFHCNIAIATLAKECNSHYFDLTEDVESVREIDALAKNTMTAFVTQCGIAPGLINIIANDLIQAFDQVNEVKLRCGDNPQHANTALKYALTWSTEGLINEYSNPCVILENSKLKEIRPLSECEALEIDGSIYEAFHTSGGIGSLPETYEGKINTMNYKTIRYPGHCEKIRFLMQDLKLEDDRKNLQHILENALPTTSEDFIIIYVNVQGIKNKKSTQKTYINTFYPAELAGISYSAIQASTSSVVCAVINTVLKQPKHYQGRVKQEDFSLSDILDNHFSAYLKMKG